MSLCQCVYCPVDRLRWGVAMASVHSMLVRQAFLIFRLLAIRLSGKKCWLGDFLVMCVGNFYTSLLLQSISVYYILVLMIKRYVQLWTNTKQMAGSWHKSDPGGFREGRSFWQPNPTLTSSCHNIVPEFVKVASQCKYTYCPFFRPFSSSRQSFWDFTTDVSCHYLALM